MSKQIPGCELATADHLARVDLSHRAEEDIKLMVLRAGSELERFFAERERAAEFWMTEVDTERVKDLRKRWSELCIKIATITSKESGERS